MVSRTHWYNQAFRNLTRKTKVIYLSIMLHFRYDKHDIVENSVLLLVVLDRWTGNIMETVNNYPYSNNNYVITCFLIVLS